MEKEKRALEEETREQARNTVCCIEVPILTTMCVLPKICTYTLHGTSVVSRILTPFPGSSGE